MRKLFKKGMVVLAATMIITTVHPVHAQTITVSDSVTEAAENMAENTEEKAITMTEGFSKKVSIQNIKILGEGKTVTYSTSNKKVVSITNAKDTSMVLNAKKPGKAKVTIKTEKASYVIKITVKADRIRPSKKEVTLKKGENCSITLKNYNTIQKSYPDKNVKFSIDNGAVATIERIHEGTVTIQGRQSGTANLTIKTSRKLYKVKLFVEGTGKNTVSSGKNVRISQKKAVITTGNTKKIYLKNYSIIENTYSNKRVYFEIDDSSIVSIEKVHKGTIYLKGKKKGKAHLTITTAKNTYHCSITVK